MPKKRNELFFSGSNLWYLVGLIASDGNLSRDGRHVDITSKDPEFLEELKQVLRLTNKVGVKYGRNHKKAFRIQIGNKNLYELLLSIGLSQKKSLTIGALKIPDEFFVDFLRGLIDGDGSIRRWFHSENLLEQWSLRIYSGSRKFLEWLEGKIKDSLKSNGKIYTYNNQKTVFVLKFGKMAARIILGNCYYENSFSLSRKNRLAHQCINSLVGWQRSKTIFAGMMKLANITDLKSVGRKALRVQVPLPAL